MSEDPLTVGVEEELFVVDAETGALRGDGRSIVEAARHRDDDQIEEELSRSQVETGSIVCTTLDDLRASLRSLRDRLDTAARTCGARVIATGTHPWSSWSDAGGVTPKPGYRRLAEDYARLTDEQVVSGCHVHVGVPDRETGIAVLDRARSHVPTLLALSANSPFWEGADTGYASFRTEVFHRWPTAGLPGTFGSLAAYEDLVSSMERTGVIDDRARIYWDVRPSARYPTLEFRVADVPMTVDESVALAGLCRALVVHLAAAVRAGTPWREPRPEMLRAALWRAARHGTTGHLIDVEAGCERPAAEAVRMLLERLREPLEAHGDHELVHEGVERILRDGTGAERQRRARARRDRREDVVDLLVTATTA